MITLDPAHLYGTWFLIGLYALFWHGLAFLFYIAIVKIAKMIV